MHADDDLGEDPPPRTYPGQGPLGWPPIGRVVAIGLAVILLGVGGFVAWASLAPLASGAVASGVIQVDTNHKTVQHLEGGIIAELLIRDGDHVEAGQRLLRLDAIESRSAYDVLENEYLLILAEEARLLAERDGRADVAFHPILEQARARPEIADMLDGQRNRLESRLALFQGKLDMVHQRIEQFNAQIAVSEEYAGALDEQMLLIAEETATVLELVEKGHERKPRLLALKRAAAQIRGSRSEVSGRILQLRESVNATALDILNLKRARIEEVDGELKRVQTRRTELEARMQSAAAHLIRRDVVAPYGGTVMRLRYHAEGGVIPAGGEILDLVPDSDTLVAEVQVSPTDIDIVRPGLPAKLILSAYKGRTTPQLDGSIVSLSPDALVEPNTGKRFFSAKIEVDSDELAKFPKIKLYPGMPLEAVIIIGERTMLDYLTQPLIDSFRRAFKEE